VEGCRSALVGLGVKVIVRKAQTPQRAVFVALARSWRGLRTSGQCPYLKSGRV
jgi:hypothetical protein